MIQQLEDIKNEVLEGNKDALVAYGELKELEVILKSTIQEVYESAIDEANKHEKNFQHLGFKFEVRKGATRYSFEHIPGWQAIDKARKDFEETSKQALKLQGKIQTATNDGEEVPLPIVTVSKDSLIVKRSKE